MPEVIALQTHEASTIKTLGEFLSQMYQEVELYITREFIAIEQRTDSGELFMCARMERRRFDVYKVPDDLGKGEAVKVIFQTVLFAQSLEVIRKKNIVRLSISSENPRSMNITMFNNNVNRISHRTMKLLDTNHTLDGPIVEEPEYTDEEHYLFTVNSDILQPGVKSVTKASKKVTIRVNRKSLSMGSGVSGLTQAVEVFGEPWSDALPVLFERVMTTNIFTNAFKLSSFSTKVHFYGEAHGPLLMCVSLGNLGEMRLYILQGETEKQ